MAPEALFEAAMGRYTDRKRPGKPEELLARVIAGGGAGERHLNDLRARHDSVQPSYGLRPGIDPGRLEQAGWGILFHCEADPALKDALKELMEWRKSQAGEYYYEFDEYKGYRSGDSHLDFLARQSMGPGPADPEKVPYYLLIVGDPESIPFGFQYQLDVQYAVGRLWFDTPEEYARYARSVVTAEKGEVALPRRAVLFGVRNPDDQATRLSAAQLVEPLGKALPTLIKKGLPAWDVQTILADGATKSRLARLLGGDETPALLFTASHGMGFPNGHPRQLPDQGALLCQDWPGPRDWDQPIPPDHYFSAADVAADASLLGLIAMHFACYGAGCPRIDDLTRLSSENPEEIAPRSFLAGLPRKLLNHPRGGALAVIGHIDRAWGYSFQWREAGPQLQCFEDALKEMMRGQPVGAALESLNQRYADLSSSLSTKLPDVRLGKRPDVEGLAGMWTANNDARNYMILGDPAARLPLVSKTSTTPKRPAIETITVTTTRSGGDPAARSSGNGRDAGAEARAGGDGVVATSPPTAGAVTTPPPGGGTIMSPPPTDFSPSAPLNDAFLAQVARTEQRFRERQARAATESVSFAPGVPEFVQSNDRDRVRRRLQRIGLSPERVEEILGGAIAFAPIPGAEAARSGPELALERILGKNDLVDVRFLEAGARAARAVGRVRIRASSGGDLGFGTGSLVAPRLLLTNNHVLRDAATAAASLVEFNVQDGLDRKPMPPTAFRLKPADFFLTSPDLDCTLVAVAPGSEEGEDLAPLGWNGPPSADDDPVLVKEYVNIIQHPGGRPKQVAMRDNQIVDLLPEFLHYRTDTEPGSSGSPVFNDQWELVGLHHSGVPRRDEQGRILAVGGGPWSPPMGDLRIDWIANEGVRLSRILRFIKDQSPSSDAGRRLRDGLFSGPPAGSSSPSIVTSKPTITINSPPSTPSPTPVATQSPSRPAPESGPPSIDAPAATSGAVTVTIPLQISVSLGQPIGTVSPSVAPTPDAAKPAGPTTATPLEEAVSIDPDYSTRPGYDPEFLGPGPVRVDLPRLSTNQERDASRVAGAGRGSNPFELKYHHYSVVMNRCRRLAFFTAVNIDGKTARSPGRERDKWFFDPRVAREEQVGNDLYTGTHFDRGHLVRRLDPAWGRTADIAKVANDDTFHFTNCSPQHERFNEGKNLWAGLEDFLLNRAREDRKRLVVFTGPVFRDDDPEVRGVPIPRDFWKVAVMIRPNGKPAALGFIVSQESLLGTALEEAAVDVARTYQVPVARVEELSGLDFGPLRGFDTGRVDGFGREAAESRELETYDDIALPGDGEEAAPEAIAYEVSAVHVATGPTDDVPGTGLGYYLLAFDDQGRERTDHPRGLVSRLVSEALATGSITDVFLFSHGWQGDVPGARRQYRDWIGAMADRRSDRDRIARQRPDFRGLLVGIHWPSLPWGDEDPGAVSFAPPADPAAALVDSYARRLGDTPEIRRHLQTIARAATAPGTPDRLPPEVAEAYRQLDRLLGLGSEGVAGPPGADRERFEPGSIYYEALSLPESAEEVGFGPSWGAARGALLAPLRTLSFWRMKARACLVGEGSVHPMLVAWQQATSGRDVRFHLVGHSFGCIVATAAVTGPAGAPALPRPVDSLSLLQGALSLWSYCGDIPSAPGRSGYFHRLFAEGRVRGPVITTQSRYDRAVGTWYPMAARAGGQVAYAAGLPKYGGVGSFGMQGQDLRPSNIAMGPETIAYRFEPGRPYNLEASRYICRGGGFSGAHSDICRPEVAHAVWSAIGAS
jgi:endonuclease G